MKILNHFTHEDQIFIERDVHGPCEKVFDYKDLFIRFMHLCKFFKIYQYQFICADSELVVDKNNHIYLYEWYPYIRVHTKDWSHPHCIDMVQVLKPYLPPLTYNKYCKLINTNCSIIDADITMSLEQLDNIINI